MQTVTTLSFGRCRQPWCWLLLAMSLGAGCTQAPDQGQVRPPRSEFRVTPALPIEMLMAQALTAMPPVEAGPFRPTLLLDLSELDPDFQFDIRYATDRNFLGAPVYRSAQAFLQADAARALVRAQRTLVQEGLGLLIYDAYRPWHVTRVFWDATPAELREYVADPSRGSRHNRGCAVDLSLYDLRTGVPLPMPTDYDDFSPAAHLDYGGGTVEQRRNRDRLRRVMEENGFLPFPAEWWHFDFQGWQEYPILNLKFEEID